MTLANILSSAITIADVEARLAAEFEIPQDHACVVGSTLICGRGNDTDVLCLVPDEIVLTAAGFVPDIEVHYQSPLRSYRRGTINVIATTSREFFFAEIAIAHAARVVASSQWDMSSRDHRVAFHALIRNSVLKRLAY